MKKILFIFIFLFPFILNAQNITAKYLVKGQVIDSVTSETLPYITCSVVLENKPDIVISRFAGDADGKFNGEIKNSGKYILIISFIGKETLKRNFFVNPEHKVVQLGKLKMSDNKQMLKSVNVVATKPLVKATIDKITYDAEQDPEAKASTALDLMRKVPMITVDGQDNIQLKGSSNFKIFLNGKPSNLFNDNPGQILKSFPANMIKNIEVITQPGAKYDAEGVGGIINIVTAQMSNAKGYSATVNTQAGSMGLFGTGLNIAAQTGKFSFSGNYNFSNFVPSKVTTTSDRNVYQSDSYTPQYYAVHQVASVKNNVPAQFGQGELSYEIDSLNLLTVSFNRHFGNQHGDNSAFTNNYGYIPNTNSEQTGGFAYSQSNSQRQNWGSTDLGTDYQHSFHKKGESVTLSYKWSNTPNNSNYEATNTIDPLFHSIPQIGLAQWSKSNNDASSNEHTFQVDFSNPVGKDKTLEVGAKYILRLNESFSNEQYKFFNFTKDYPYSLYPESQYNTFFKNNQDIIGTYLSYTANFGKFGFKPGIRYEYTLQHITNQDTTFNSDYGVVVPSVTFSYQLPSMQTLKLGYNMRIQRPGIGYLSPYVDRRDPNYITYGNPDLDPEKNHNISLGYSRFASKYNISAELTYTFINNAIEQYSFIRPGSNIQEITYGNIGHNNKLFLNAFGSYSGLTWLNFYLNADVGYVDLKSNSYNMSNTGFTGHMYFGGSLILPKNFRISFGGGANLPQVNLQGSQSSFVHTYTALSKDFLDKKLNISLVGVYLPKSHIDITTNGYNTITGNPTFYQHTDVHIIKPYELRINISYRIGNLTAQVKKTRATISNDDQKTKQSDNTGQGL
ncbi:MAG: TonB-dependent receptor [Bacteroidota bacterium]|nr:TonB-dependent receptor [Bacteroidota bacterium]